MNKRLLFILIVFLFGGWSWAQESVYDIMSLDELLDVDVIVSASKKPEDLFEAPLSVTIIKKQEIIKSGATSIPEALRLAPGLIVREMTPGNYDVHIRGFDDVLRNSYIAVPYNNIILVMIDNRIVYSYYSGGTYWEAFPVDIDDVERIEVVRGPASALYGPNAASGVINIITSHAKEYGSNVSFNGQYGSNNTTVINAGYGYNHEDKIKISVTGNYRHRERWDEQYYDWAKMKYTDFDSISMMLRIYRDSLDPVFVTFDEFNGGYKQRNVSLEHFGVNAFLDYNISEKTSLNVSTGYQTTLNQKPYFSAFSTSIAQLDSWGYYVNARFKTGNFYSQFSYSFDERNGVFPFHSDRCNIADVNMEYDFSKEKFSLRPGFNIRQTYANNSGLMKDRQLYMGSFRDRYGDKPRGMFMPALSMLAEWRPTMKLRLISGLRFDIFSINDNLSFNYEIGATYRLNKNNMLRAVHSRANRAPFLLDTYANMNCRIIWPLSFSAFGNQDVTNIYANTNWGTEPNIKYLTNQTIELGWRSKLSSSADIDVEAFANRLTNFIGTMVYRDLYPNVKYTGVFPSITIDSIQDATAKVNIVFDNYDLTAIQFGLTPTFSIKLGNNLKMKLFATIQKTTLKGETSVNFDTLESLGLLVNDTLNHILHMYERVKINPTQYSTKSTPSCFGGVEINYAPGERWNFNLNGYYYSSQVYTGLSYENFAADRTGNYGHFTHKIDAYFILNTKITYLFRSKLQVYLSARNLFGKHREFGFADNIGSIYMTGISYNF